ncbi:hypothetical protein LCGC14_1428530 [marine sediment metagenome]|uniref:Uncharacterized protein n=1 Tax=marine sediment metagenome TaxID=412755 RepID=A0A0F9JPB6_9ZZZZ
MKPKNSPMHPHDCSCCQFLGTYDTHDLYFCSSVNPTVIARFGSDGDYESGLAFGKAPLTDRFMIPHLHVAYLIAQDLGLVGKNNDKKTF